MQDKTNYNAATVNNMTKKVAENLLLPEALMEIWSCSPTPNSASVVLPDGCSDFVVRTYQHKASEFFVVPFVDAAYCIASGEGEHFIGYRFRPGAQINQTRLDFAMQACATDTLAVLTLIEDCVRLDRRVVEALDCLSEAQSVTRATYGLGVSERSLERLIGRATGRTPNYWKNLARVRRAAVALSSDLPLVELAADYGFSDQSHMNRAFKHWFGVSPHRFRCNPVLLSTVGESGY